MSLSFWITLGGVGEHHVGCVIDFPFGREEKAATMSRRPSYFDRRPWECCGVERPQNHTKVGRYVLADGAHMGVVLFSFLKYREKAGEDTIQVTGVCFEKEGGERDITEAV